MQRVKFARDKVNCQGFASYQVEEIGEKWDRIEAFDSVDALAPHESLRSDPTSTDSFNLIGVLQAVVRRFPGDRHVVRVRLAEARGRYAHELRLGA